MKTIERVMRVMTQVNVGATLGMAAWILWSGHRVVSGEWPRPPAPPTATRITPSAVQPPARSSCCLVPADVQATAPRVLEAHHHPLDQQASAGSERAP